MTVMSVIILVTMIQMPLVISDSVGVEDGLLKLVLQSQETRPRKLVSQAAAETFSGVEKLETKEAPRIIAQIIRIFWDKVFMINSLFSLSYHGMKKITI